MIQRYDKVIFVFTSYSQIHNIPFENNKWYWVSFLYALALRTLTDVPKLLNQVSVCSLEVWQRLTLLFDFSKATTPINAFKHQDRKQGMKSKGWRPVPSLWSSWRLVVPTKKWVKLCCAVWVFDLGANLCFNLGALGVSLKDSHQRAWVVVKEYIEANLFVFPSKMEHAESALMPTAKSWIRRSIEEMNCSSPEDHSIFLWLNCPVVGIVPSDKYDFFLTCISNFLSDWPRNSVCIIIHPNRASSLDKRTDSEWGLCCVALTLWFCVGMRVCVSSVYVVCVCVGWVGVCVCSWASSIIISIVVAIYFS